MDSNKNERRFMKFAEVSVKVGLGRTAIYKRISEGTFPEPRKVGRASLWVSSEIDAWVTAITETGAVPLTNLRRAMGLDLDDKS